MQLPMKTLLALLPFFLKANAQASGTGTTTRYWDCCKPSCSWPGKATLLSGSNPVTTCDINNNPLTDYNAVSGCDSGTAYMCSTESPWAVSDDLSYGYAAVNIAGGTEASWCCACYELTFTSGPVAGKKMIVQATNTGGDLGSNQFDLSIPGGGVGIFDGCTTEWGAPPEGWGAQYGGISTDTCSTFPSALQDGCSWRFGWFEDADNPTVSFTQVECPAAITANSGCVRADDSTMPAPAADPDAGTAVSSAAAVVADTSSADPPAATSTATADGVVAAVDPPATTSAADPVAAVDPPATSSSADPVASSAALGAAVDPPATTPAASAANAGPTTWVYVTSTLSANSEKCEL